MIFSNNAKGFSNLDGTSLLVGDPKVSFYEVEFATDKTIMQTLQIRVNSDGTLKNIETRFLADNLMKAANSGVDYIQSFLSWLSFRHDAGIEVSQYLTLEESTYVSLILTGCLGQLKQLIHNDEVFLSTPLHRILMSAYREALNTTSVFYRFLSFYRVAEGVRKLRITEKRHKNNANHLTEKIPEDLNSLVIADKDNNLHCFIPFQGKKFSYILDELLRNQVRNAIAHINPSNPLLFNDDPGHFRACW